MRKRILSFCLIIAIFSQFAPPFTETVFARHINKHKFLKKKHVKSKIIKNRFVGLEKKLQSAVFRNYGSRVLAGYRIGISFKDVRSGYLLSVNGSRRFPAASIIKLPVMAYLFNMSDKKLINLSSRIYFSDSDKLPGAGILQWLHPNSYSMWNLCRMMISLSDNTATRLLVNRVGMKKINSYCRRIGLRNTRILDPTALTEPPRRNVNTTTANDIVKLLHRIETGKGFSSSSRKDMLSFMLNQKYRFGIPLVLPRGFVCANKTGNLEHVLHDSAIVYAPRGTYVLCVFTKGFKYDRSARLVINEISRIIAEYYR